MAKTKIEGVEFDSFLFAVGSNSFVFFPPNGLNPQMQLELYQKLEVVVVLMPISQMKSLVDNKNLKKLK